MWPDQLKLRKKSVGKQLLLMEDVARGCSWGVCVHIGVMVTSGDFYWGIENVQRSGNGKAESMSTRSS